MSASTKAVATMFASGAGVPAATSNLCTKPASSLDATTNDWLMTRLSDSTASVGVAFVGVPGGFYRVVRTIIDLDHHGFFVRQGRPVYIAFRIAIEAAGFQRHARAGVLVVPRKTEHHLVGGVHMRFGNAGSLGELDQGERGACRLVTPQHLFVNTCKRFCAPRNRIRLDQQFVEAWCTSRKVHLMPSQERPDCPAATYHDISR